MEFVKAGMDEISRDKVGEVLLKFFNMLNIFGERKFESLCE